ncbi:hypothetical protein [Streptomyces sp. BK239]|uniref:hypothetical protein n=1 Tax=Streptomyces sp. BK239 TaxID=2512155 RepID=UPI00102CCF92|nr:hypothetical protein [Streptomyces sp. BK239]RZU16870.1 hypothetical protein EV567_3302 [Streptomyces sp. BK239]
MRSEANFRDIPSEKSLFVVDIKDFSRVPESRVRSLRCDLHDILTRTFTRSDLAEEWGCKEFRDTGDGAIFALTPHRMPLMVDPALNNLNQELIRYNRNQSKSSHPLYLRVSFDVGPLPFGEPSDASINACRLINSGLAYAGINAAVDNGAYVAAVISQTAFNRIVDAGRLDLLSASDFLPATAQVTGKSSFNERDEQAYIHVPGVSCTAIEAHLAALSAGHRHIGSSPATSTPNTAVNAAQSSAAPKFQFNSNVGTVADHIDTVYQPISFPVREDDR